MVFHPKPLKRQFFAHPDPVGYLHFVLTILGRSAHRGADRDGEYVAYYESEILQAQFCLYLKVSIFGAFAEMIRKVYAKNYQSQEIDFQGGEVPVSFENRVLLDVLDRQHAACA